MNTRMKTNNVYFGGEITSQLWAELESFTPHMLGKLLRLLSLAKSHNLREQDFEDFMDAEIRRRFGWCVARAVYTAEVAWALYTVEFLDSLAKLSRLLASKATPQVLEVMAGQGTLARPMADRNIQWTCTDSDPITREVVQRNALAAISEFGDESDLLFVSWVPYESTEDLAILNEWVRKRGKPLIIVGEGKGGCTGSRAFWEELAHFNHCFPAGRYRWFRDVPTWNGMHDQTLAVRKVGSW